jgi:hypothetical protein
MIVRAGFQTFEFQQVFELPKPLFFDREEDARSWLRQLWSQDPGFIVRIREYLMRESGDESVFRLTDHEAIERLAVLLNSRRVVVIRRETRRSAGGPPVPRAEKIAPPFPLSDLKQRAASIAARVRAIVPQPVTAPLWIRLDLTAKQAARQTGQLRLVGSTGYDKTLAIAGNFVANPAEANTVDVLFEDVPTAASYSLTHTADDGTKSTIVQSVPFDSLKDPSMEAKA